MVSNAAPSASGERTGSQAAPGGHGGATLPPTTITSLPVHASTACVRGEMGAAGSVLQCPVVGASSRTARSPHAPSAAARAMASAGMSRSTAL